MKIILTFITVLILSNMTLAEDPNLAINGQSQAGTLMQGTDFNAQVPVCVKCQNRNNLNLTDTKDNFQPGSAGSAPGSNGSSGAGDYNQ